MNDYVKTELKTLMKKIKDNKNSFVFKQPIEEIIQQIPEYTKIIEKPIDLVKIEYKLNSGVYSAAEEFKEDIDIMISNCLRFNEAPDHWVRKIAISLDEFITNNYKKSEAKINKFIEKYNNNLQKSKAGSEKKVEVVETSKNQILYQVNSEDEKIYKRIKNLFFKISSSINISEEQLEELVNHVSKSIIKGNKTFELIYEDTMKALSKYIFNDGSKSYFSKKFRKILRALKEEQQENKNLKHDFKMKINLDEENTENKEEKIKIKEIKNIISSFIENQRIPESFMDNREYPIESNLKKKITSHVADLRLKFTTTYK